MYTNWEIMTMELNTSDDLRQRIALAVGAHRNGLASDGQGWFRNETDETECYALADAVLSLFAEERAAADSLPAFQVKLRRSLAEVRAAAFREAADIAEGDDGTITCRELRRMAREAEDAAPAVSEQATR